MPKKKIESVEQTEEKKPFDKAEYIKQYHKDHYKKLTLVLSKEDADRIEKAAEKNLMSKSKFAAEIVKDYLDTHSL